MEMGVWFFAWDCIRSVLGQSNNSEYVHFSLSDSFQDSLNFFYVCGSGETDSSFHFCSTAPFCEHKNCPPEFYQTDQLDMLEQNDS